MISVETASQLLDFGARIKDPKRALEQLEGAVAIHHLLHNRRVAYLADEVGMGKTYVALGALALFRHFNPNFRVLVLAPRENIQRKWMKEMGNFIAHNVRFPDLRLKGVDGHPVRPMVCCDNLIGLAHETAVNPNRDFFVRLTSFSLPVGSMSEAGNEQAIRLRNDLLRHFPSLPLEAFHLNDKRRFKDNVARAICHILPVFDLVIVDEGHNLKHGFGEHVAARNRVLSLAMGHKAGLSGAEDFPNYQPRAQRVLFLSATPVEETYTHLWNQLDVFGRSAGFEELRRDDVAEERKKELAAQFLIRRVATINVNGTDLTKNQYRREWRSGGLAEHDHPIKVTDPRQRLIVALVQKKVNEILHLDGFSASYQIGMLASFESFLQTAKLRTEENEVATFDDAGQADDLAEKDGIDVADLNRMASSYRGRFGEEMPHPKMDAVAGRLAQAWTIAEKALVFVRRTASVSELKRKLDDSYDDWLINRLKTELPNRSLKQFQRAETRYRKDRLRFLAKREALIGGDAALRKSADMGGADTFFAWFFRGDGPKGLVSGANVQQRFTQRGTTVATFFDDNYVSFVLGCQPDEATARLAEVLGLIPGDLRRELGRRAMPYLSRAKKVARGDRYESIQAAAIEWLKNTTGPLQPLARAVWQARFESSRKLRHADMPVEVTDELEERTFFTELRLRPELRGQIWPESIAPSPEARFREQEFRARLLATAARLGHAFIDYYILAINRLGSLRQHRQEKSEEDSTQSRMGRIHEYLSLLESQMRTSPASRPWRAYDELAEIAANYDLILDVNAPSTRTDSFDEVTRAFAQLLGRQQPVGGMAGQINQTLVRQFRMPGYPFVLISTDLLQEGEDLHTFCSAVHHYGISWTPSSMEQRIGRVDRVRSQTDRRLGRLTREASPQEFLQVFFPHLSDTVEVLQVNRVLERMNTFLRLMHEGLTITDPPDRKIDLRREFAGEKTEVPRIATKLKTAFPIPPSSLEGKVTSLASGPELAFRAEVAFAKLRQSPCPGLEINWEVQTAATSLLGTAMLEARQQPFSLLLQCFQDRLMVRCISPIGRVAHVSDLEQLQASVAHSPAKIGAIPGSDDRSYNLSVEGDVLFCENASTNLVRVSQLIHRIVHEADRLEHLHLDGRDEPLSTFRSDLEKESSHGH
jgi:hypothetical protein